MNSAEPCHEREVPLSANQIETLRVIHNSGPTWDGDVPSKVARDVLLAYGLIAKVVVRGEDGFQACTYRGRAVLRAFQRETENTRFR